MRSALAPLPGALWLAAAVFAGAGASPRRPTGERVTFNEHIAPIVFERCAPCHRPDGPAPFPLVSYADVRKHAAQIAQVTRDHYMPPWLPDPGELPFAGERRLSDEEIDRIARWVAQGAVKGDAAALLPTPQWPTDWQLGEPDLIVGMPEPYTVPAGGPDLYRNFVIPVAVEARKFVKAVELRPGSQRVLHHAVVAVDHTRFSRQRDRADPQPGFDFMFPARAESPDGHFIGWTPGKAPAVSADEMAWRLDRGTDLVLQLHMTPSGRPEAVQVRIGLFFADRPPSRMPFMLRVGSKALDIPAGEHAYVTEDRFLLPVEVELRGVYPHAHYLARDIQGSATLPGGRTISLIRIRDWDFKWQDEYQYAAPIVLPRGTIISARFTFDNSSANPRNPHTPPRPVAYGSRSMDEMGDLWLQVVPRNAEDLAVLREAFEEHERRQNIAGYEATVRAHPADAIGHTRLGTFYFLAGRQETAIRQYRRALELQPRLWLAHYNLGIVLQAAGRIDEAISHYEHAVAAEPQDAESHHAWGQALESKGKLREAVARYQEALRLWPEYADVLNSWGNLLVREGRTDEALERYRAALEIRPDHVPVLNNLGITLAQQGKVDEAVQLFQQAIAIDPRHPSSRTNLKEALALQRERMRMKR